jgi:3-oxoacyl-[acyl-carrier protein] reductase
MKTTKMALVTGASSGIGRAVALRLARDGFHVLVHYNSNKTGGELTLNQITEAGGQGQLIHFDVKDANAVEKALEDFAKTNKISVLINNAGIHQDGLTGLMSDDAFDSVMKTNVYGPFYLLRWCVRRMIKERDGIIVNVASLAGQTGNAGQINYAASKAALIAMTKTLSSEVASRGIRVNAVAPGLIETEMIAAIPQVEKMKAHIPMGRIGTSDEVAGCVSFLCSPDSSYVTGHTLSVNGGLFPS